MGLGLDGDTYSFYIDENVTSKFDLINTQIVTLTNDYSPKDTSYIYSKGSNGFNISLFSSDYWGSPVYSVYLGENSGALNLETAHFNSTGQTFINNKGGSFSLENGSVDSINNIAEKDSRYNLISITASTLPIPDKKETSQFKEWRSNISNSREFSSGGIIASTMLDRSIWKATASNNKGAARNALDGKISTRWDTGTQQVPGQWFEVNLGGEYTFNYIILDVGSSTGDTPAQWNIYVSNDGETWGDPIASGKEGSGIISFEPQTASYIKIEQNGKKDGLYWSIHEMYVYYMK